MHNNLPIIMDGKSDIIVSVLPILTHIKESSDDKIMHAMYEEPDYHTALNKMHTEFPLGTVRDKMVHELASKGVPDINTHHQIGMIIGTEPDPAAKSELMSKYSFLNRFVKGPRPKILPHESFLTHDEVMQHKNDHTFIGGRKIKHNVTGHVYELDKNSTKRLIDNQTENQLFPHVKENADHQELEQNINRFSDPWKNQAHIKAVKDYTEESGIVNRLLAAKYTGDNSKIDEHHKNDIEKSELLSSTLTKTIRARTPYPGAFKVYSGMSRSFNPKVNEGQTEEVHYHAPTFLSTSISPQSAASFARDKNWEHATPSHQRIRDVLHFDIPRNYEHGAYVEPISHNSGEREYILNKGHTFSVHPIPKYFSQNGTLHRVWEGKLHPQIHEEGNESLLKP